MKINKRTLSKAFLPQMTILFLFSLVFLINACASSGNYGYFEYSDETKKIFESYQVLPDHNYFYSGSDARPDAIIALQKEYTLQTKLWKPIEMTSKQLKRWVNYGSSNRAVLSPTVRYGRDLFDNNGAKIGVWYSLKHWNARTAIEMIDESKKIVSIATPIKPTVQKSKPAI